ncbi:phage tail assembly chaperone [Clostridium scatologenes]|uniref:XkdN-like protein n=1 Tax=Clostridium scatologenes TaxID=1548 RepID=A0A0E3K0B3_CLOSL|nr:hypothetical protein [Clostridium scatologenes]AKA69837.1 XkdN-like protein [Clostridium scatologenes]
MSKIDLLLKLDKSKLVRPTKEIEIKRLSEVLGEPFSVTVQSITADEFEDIQNAVSINADGKVESEKNIQAKYVVSGIKDPDFNNQQVIEQFGAVNAAEAVNNIFLPGEITAIFNVINELSGFSKDSVKEIKNLSPETAKQI